MGLSDELQSARWFGGKSREIASTRIVDRAGWVDGATLSFIEVQYVAGPAETYVLAERLGDAGMSRAVLDRFVGDTVATEAGGRLDFRPTDLFAVVRREQTEPITVMTGEQSNTSIRFGDALVLKLFRRLQFGPNPDVEIGCFLTEHSTFRGTPAVVGSLEYTSPEGAMASLALLQVFEPNRGDAWTTTLDRLQRVLHGSDPAESVESIARLGATTAEMHLALAAGGGEFAAEPISAQDVAAWRLAIHDEVHAAVQALAAHGMAVDAATLVERADGVRKLLGADKTRHHGDYHLGQILEREDGSFVVIDFEGEPAKPLADRREKRSPLRDVAGLLRSLDYVRNAALRASAIADGAALPRASRWYNMAREAFLGTYVAAVRRARPSLLPQDLDAPLSAFELEKAAYEVLYELNNRPDWLPIPLAALRA